MKILIGVGVAVLAIVIIFGIWFGATPAGRRAWNNHWFGVQEAEVQTDWETLRSVEDTARAMIASYNADVLMWEQFRDSEDQQERNWANGARMRANRTASTYNEFITQNRFVWRDAVPPDIFMTLPTVGD